MSAPDDPVTNPCQTHTDLPLLPGGNNGNRARGPKEDAGTPISRLLQDVFEPLPQPRFELLDAREVREWVDRATAHLVFRRERQDRLSEAMRVLEEEWRTARRSERLREQAARQQERLNAKLRTGYWRDRDARRSATRPAHVLVDPAAWERAKVVAQTRRSSVGVVIGEVVSREVRRPRRRSPSPDVSKQAVRLFARIAVQAEVWAQVRSLAARNEVSLERFVGGLIEEAFESPSSPR